MIFRSLLCVFVSALIASRATAPAPLSFERLRCEALREPQGIDVAVPQLSWAYASPEKNLLPTHGEVLVATSPELLSESEADAWKSGPLELRGLPSVEYAGQPLTTHTRDWWKVRAWQPGQEPSPWSEPCAVWSWRSSPGGRRSAEPVQLERPMDRPRSSAAESVSDRCEVDLVAGRRHRTAGRVLFPSRDQGADGSQVDRRHVPHRGR